MKAAVYARVSTDKQSADSPADQVARCREFAMQRGWTVVESLVVEDSGISGASRHNRPRLLELVARIDEWDVLLCFDLSRLARDSEDLGWIRNRLRVHRRTAYEASTGLDIFNVGSKVMGVLNEEYLTKLRADVHRGLRGRAERGLHAGGLPYGYRTDPVASGKVDAHGTEIPAGYRLVVDHERAAVVRHIFNLYGRGEGFRAIAHVLNAEGGSSPRGRGWAPSALRALIRNPIYKGESVWNRSEWIKDHETGKRKRFERPESEWVQQRDETWRIVADEVWARAQWVMARKRAAFTRRPDGTIVSSSIRAARRRHLLSGLLECGECGGSFFALRKGGIYGCGWHRDRGPEVCRSDLQVDRNRLEERVVGAIRDRILTPENAAYAIERAFALVREELQGQDPEADRARLAEIDLRIQRAVDLAIETGGIEQARRKIESLKGAREPIAERLRAAGKPIELELLRHVIEARVMDFREAFAGAPGECRAALGVLLAGRRMAVHRVDTGFRVEGLFEVPLTHEPPGAGYTSGRFDCVVAGEGFEPPTSGL